jgi:MFS family permease
MLVAGLSPSPWLAIAAFAVAGLGIANVVPIIFSAAGNQPGMASATGMSVVTTMGYSGILLAPSAIGFTAEYTGFTIVFVALSALLVIVGLMGRLASSADFKHSP